MVRMVEFDKWGAESKFNQAPKPGETFEFDGDDYFILSSKIENRSKLILKVQKIHEVKMFQDFTSESLDWEEFDDDFLPP